MSAALDAFDRAVRQFPPPQDMKTRARALLGCTDWSGDFTPHLTNNYLVKGVLNCGELSMIYGPSNTGKTFLAIDLAQAVEAGRPWFGRRVRRGRVLYCSLEGGGGFVNRCVAAGASFWALRADFTLTGPRADTAPLIEVAQLLGGLHGRFALIVVDTLARAMGRADENAAADIADLIRNCDTLRAATGAHVLAIHHSGKDVGRGARGHSALRAALDAEIVLARDDDGVISATLDKARDGATGARLAFRLRQVELGVDEDGDPVTSCVVAPENAAASHPQEPGKNAAASHPQEPGKAGRVALEALDALIAASGPSDGVTLDAWRDAAIAAGVSRATNYDARRSGFHKARHQLEALGLVEVEGQFVGRARP